MGQWIERLLEVVRARKLDRLAAAYAVGSWLLVQAASIALPAYDAPAWMLRWLIAATVMGFMATLSAAWVWNRPDPRQTRTLRRSDAAFLGLTALVAVLTLGELAWHWSSQKTGEESVAENEPSKASIAVLPFANVSGDLKQKYFSEGISEELIGLLSRNQALRVAARTSSFYFEGKDQDIRDIARKLNVRAVLEGSVREDHGRVRIEAALIDAADGYQIWSQSYDRELTDILVLQSDIANAIASALAPEILGGKAKPVLPKPIPIDPDAYRMYLEGQFYFEKRTDADVARAFYLFQQVATLAPDFADGQAALAYALQILRHRHPGIPGQDGQFAQALTHALKLDPTNPQALTVAIFDAGIRRQWDTVLNDAIILKRSNHHSAIGLHGLYAAYSQFALTEQALEAEQEWARLDPLSVVARMNVAQTFIRLGRWQEGAAAAGDALSLSPGNPGALMVQCSAFARSGKFSQAKKNLAALSVPGASPATRKSCLMLIAQNEGDLETAHTLADDAAAHFGENGTDEIDVGDGFALAGEFDRAMDWFERGFDDHADVFSIYQGKNLPEAFYRTPRWIAMTQRPEYQRWLAARARARNELADTKF